LHKSYIPYISNASIFGKGAQGEFMIQQKHELKLKCAVVLLLVTAGMAHALTDRYWTGGASIVWKD
jgi:hypothetical protein